MQPAVARSSLQSSNPSQPLPSRAKAEESPKQISSFGDTTNLGSSALVEVMKKLNEITKMLVKEQKSSKISHVFKFLFLMVILCYSHPLLKHFNRVLKSKLTICRKGFTI